MTFNQPKLPKGLKTRRHHNNKGRKQMRLGRTVDQVKALAKRLGIPYVTRTERDSKDE